MGATYCPIGPASLSTWGVNSAGFRVLRLGFRVNNNNNLFFYTGPNIREPKFKTRNPDLRAHRVGLRITPEHFDKGAVFFQFVEGVLYKFVFAVTVDVDEEKVLPIFPLGRPAFNFAHAQLEPVEGFQSRVERADTIVNTKH